MGGEHTTERTEFNQFMQANSRSTKSSSVANQQLYNVNSQPEKQLARDNSSFRASFRHRFFDNDLGSVSRTFRSPLGPVFIFQKRSLENGLLGPSSLRDGPLFLTGGGEGWKIFTCKRFLPAAPTENNFFCLRLNANTFCTCIQFISVFTASANNLFQT